MPNVTSSINQEVKVEAIKVANASNTVSPLEVGKVYFMALLTNYNVSPNTIIISGAEYLAGQSVSYSNNWYNYGIAFKATATSVKLRGSADGNYWGLMKVSG